MKMYFPRFNETEKSNFWNVLAGIKENAIKQESEWDGDYLDTIYTMQDGRKYLYSENMEYGIPHSIEWL